MNILICPNNVTCLSSLWRSADCSSIGVSQLYMFGYEGDSEKDKLVIQSQIKMDVSAA